ncbi:MAG: YqjD family protein [Burkholderiales bacterium]|jgi:ElaB/YqjD/DUF883 family membrane-anchored ribosome-binding protein
MTTARAGRRRKSVAADFGEVLGQAESLLDQATFETGERASDLRSQVAAKIMAAKAMLEDLQRDALGRAKAAAGAADDRVRDNPWLAVGVAVAAGFLVGALISRR